MIGVADVELIPAGDVTTAGPSEQQCDADAQTLEQSGGANHIVGERALFSVSLCPELFEAAEGPMVCGQHLTAQEAVKSKLRCWRIGRRTP